MRSKRADKLNIAEAANKLGMSTERLSAELQRDAKRPINERHYPFANPIRNDENGRWSYNIVSKKLDSYLLPEYKPGIMLSDDQLIRLGEIVAENILKYKNVG